MQHNFDFVDINTNPTCKDGGNTLNCIFFFFSERADSKVHPCQTLAAHATNFEWMSLFGRLLSESPNWCLFVKMAPIQLYNQLQIFCHFFFKSRIFSWVF